MKNADMPAMPQDYGIWCDGIGDCPTLATGLTKREYFAAMAMQGLCANSIAGRHHHPENLSVEAVQYADALLAELEKQQ